MAYGVVKLAVGNTGFSAQLMYDIEVWIPCQNTYREISSILNFGTFQARHANIRTRGEDGKPKLVATLNGSGLPIGRTLAALLEAPAAGRLPPPSRIPLPVPRLPPDLGGRNTGGIRRPPTTAVVGRARPRT